jgi:hypothetical protein
VQARGSIPQKLIRWGIFSVIIALLPVFFNLLTVGSRGGSLSLRQVASHGELLLISTAIAAASVGDLIASGSKLPMAKILAGGGCIVGLFLGSLWYADISAAQAANVVLNPAWINNGSAIVFALTLVSSGSCVALAEV